MSETMAAILASRQSPSRRAIRMTSVIPRPSSTSSVLKMALRHLRKDIEVRGQRSEVSRKNAARSSFN